jgi:aryl-alcohol dehydrogenase-like predicted oxidoreductase
MRYRPLGRSGLMVSELTLGTMVFGEKGDRGTPPDESIAIIRRYLDAGGNHLDGANVYASGRSEEIIGRAVSGRRDDVVIATKVRFPMGDGPNDVGLSRLHIMRSVDDSLRRLDTDFVDLLYMHCWDPITPIEESLHAFDDLVHAGKVRYIGVSNFKAWQVMQALAVSERNGWARFDAAQYQYSLVERDIEREFIDLCTTTGLGIMPWSPLGGGFLSGKYQRGDRPATPQAGRLAGAPDHVEEAWHRRATERNWQIIDAVAGIAAARGCSQAQVAIAWLLTRPAVASVILGVRTMAHLEDALEAPACNLERVDLDRLDAASAIVPGYPYRFIESFGSRSLD